MTIPRIYSPNALENINTCELGEDNLKYLKKVMRLKQGDRINIFDGYGREFEAVIKNYTAKAVLVELGKSIPASAKQISITLAQALPKAKKMDNIVKTAAELGADKIIPFHAVRSVAHIDDEKGALKVQRWQKIAMEAARASHSSRITEVSKILSFSDMIFSATEDNVKLIFWEEESLKNIKDILTAKELASVKRFFVLIGPEGGFSKNEVEGAKKAGFVSVSLGMQILKVETAAAAVISIIQYERGIFGKTQEVNNDLL